MEMRLGFPAPNQAKHKQRRLIFARSNERSSIRMLWREEFDWGLAIGDWRLGIVDF